LNSKKRSACSVATELLAFVVFGVPMLVLAQAVDAYYFVAWIYRSDVMEYGNRRDLDFTMSEK